MGAGVRLLLLELRKLRHYRSVRPGLLVAALLPPLWALAPRLEEVYGLTLISGHQVQAIALMTSMEFVLPILVAVTCAELLGYEVAAGTLAPLLLRPLTRIRLLLTRIRLLLAKLGVALLYPGMLLAVLWLSGLVSGALLGYGDFQGGTGLTLLGFASPFTGGATAFGEVARAYGLAWLVLAPVATLAVLLSVLLLNTAAAALATLVTLLVTRMLIVFPAAVQPLLLTTHFGAYLGQGRELALSVGFLLLYTLAFAAMSVFAFERRDV